MKIGISIAYYNYVLLHYESICEKYFSSEHMNIAPRASWLDVFGIVHKNNCLSELRGAMISSHRVYDYYIIILLCLDPGLNQVAIFIVVTLASHY